MANKISDEVFDSYFDDGSWTLFTAICLLRNIDPKDRKEPIFHKSVGGKDDPTTRYYKVALSALKKAETGIAAVELSQGPAKDSKLDPPLYEIDHDAEAEGAARHYVDPREFVKWARARFPKISKHLEAAEERYQSKKKWSGLSTEERESLAEKEFWAMLSEMGLSASDSKGKFTEWAKLLETRLTKFGDAWGFERIRKEIPDWLYEGPPSNKNT